MLSSTSTTRLPSRLARSGLYLRWTPARRSRRTDLMVAGHREAEISWVGPVRFYAKAGATVSRVFRSQSKRL